MPMRLSDRTLRAGVAAVLAVTALAGCGGSSSKNTTATTATTVNGKPTTLTGSQTADLTAASQALVSAASTFLVAINRCPATKDRKACVRRSVNRADPVITKSRDAIARLSESVGGDCKLQLADVRSKITDVTDTLGPMAEATSKGSLRSAGALGNDAQLSLRTFATSSLIVDRAC
jgi:outer membrane murein-binding lipoprotein Lpp